MKLLAFLGFGWSKWTTVETNKLMYQETTNPIMGLVSSGHVYVDVQRKENHLTGRIKFKNIIR